MKPNKTRIDFALITLTGNQTRYDILRPLIEKRTDIAARWFPIRTWYKEDPLRFLPTPIRMRLRHLLDTWKLYLTPPGDAIVLHVFETYYLYTAFHRFFRHRHAIINNPDGRVSISQKHKRYENAVAETDLFIFWSEWAAEETLTHYPHIPPQKIKVLHPGINLNEWPLRVPPPPAERYRILFIGGDLFRKGADTLLDAFEQYLQDDCELFVCTQSAYFTDHPEIEKRLNSLAHVHVTLDKRPQSEEITHLRNTCDVFVLPTNGDTSSWVAIECMASGIPVIISPMRGIYDIVIEDETGLHIPPKDPKALADAVNRLRSDPVLYETLVVNGRKHIEANFDAEKNTERYLSLIEAAILTKENRK